MSRSAAAAIALPHPKWGERPLLVVVPRDDAAANIPSITVMKRIGLIRDAVRDFDHPAKPRKTIATEKRAEFLRRSL